MTPLQSSGSALKTLRQNGSSPTFLPTPVFVKLAQAATSEGASKREQVNFMSYRVATEGYMKSVAGFRSKAMLLTKQAP